MCVRTDSAQLSPVRGAEICSVKEKRKGSLPVLSKPQMSYSSYNACWEFLRWGFGCMGEQNQSCRIGQFLLDVKEVKRNTDAVKVALAPIPASFVGLLLYTHTLFITLPHEDAFSSWIYCSVH